MIKVITESDEILFNGKQEVLNHFQEVIKKEKESFFNGQWIKIEGELISDLGDWNNWVEFFNEKVFRIIKDLEYLKGVEFTLLEMDNKIQEITESENSLFAGEIKEYVENGEFVYTAWIDEKKTKVIDINIHFNICDMDIENEVINYTSQITDVEIL